MYDLLKEFIKPELLILIPVLYVIGIALKKSAISDNKIPYILGISGVILTLLYLFSTNYITDIQTAFMILFTGITQGVLLAAASVYVNQLIIQNNKSE